MATPWDPQPSPPAPAWKADVSAVLDKITKMDVASAAKLPVLDAIKASYETLETAAIAAKNWEAVNEADALIVSAESDLKNMRQIRADLVYYRGAVNNFALNQPFYDRHPELAQPAFPIMPADLLAYLKVLETQVASTA